MAVNTILLYAPVESQGSLHQIDIRDPHFAGNIGGSGWTTFAPNGEHNWLLYEGDALYDGGGPWIPWPLHQYLSAPPKVGVHYAVTVEYNIPIGELRVNLGNTVVLSGLTGAGTAVGSFYASGPELPEWLAFWPSQTMEGRILSVSIIQDPVLSPPAPEIDWQPRGYLDLDEEEAIALSWEVTDVRSLSSRYGAYSKTFSIPATPNNKLLLGHLHSDSAVPYIFDPRNKVRATFLADSVPAFRGWLSLKKVIRNTSSARFEIEFLSDQFSLVDSIKNKTLQDLDFDGLSHRLSLESILSSHHPNRNWREGWIYPLYHLLVDARTVNDDFKPAVFFRYLLDRIMVEAGYGYDLSPKVQEKIDRMIVAPTGKRPAASSDELDLMRNYSSTNNNSWNEVATSFSQQSNGYPYSRKAIKWEIEEEAPIYSLVDQSKFIPSFTGPHDLSCHISATITSSNPVPSIYNGSYPTTIVNGDLSFIDVQLWDVDANTKVRQIGTNWVAPADGVYFPFSDSHSWTGGTYTVDLVAGKPYEIRAEVVSAGKYSIPIYPAGTATGYLGFYADFSIGELKLRPSNGYPVGEGMRVNIGDWLPKVSQESFMADFIALFNLHLIPDAENAKLIHFVAQDELDWGREIILHDEIHMDSVEIEHLTEIASSAISFNYKEHNDKDDFNLQWKDLHRGVQYGSEDFSFNTNLYNEPNEVRLKNFTPTPITKDSEGRWVPAILSRSQEKDLKLLLLGQTSIPTTLPIGFFSAESRTHGVHVAQEYTPMLHVNDITGGWTGRTYCLNFGRVDKIMTDSGANLPANTLVENHYRRQLEQLRDGRLYTMEATLSLAQVQELTQHIGASIYSHQLKKWFTLYKLIDFDPSQAHNSLTKLQLLEIVNRGGSTEGDFTYRAGGATVSLTGLDYVQNASSTSSAGGLSPTSNIFNITQIVNGGDYLPTSGGTGGPYILQGLTQMQGSAIVQQELTATTYFSGSTNLQDLFGVGDLQATLERGNVSNGLNIILSSATLVAGQAHTFNDTSGTASILGGNTSTVEEGSASAIIIGGNNNAIQYAPASTILGGELNTINGAYYSSILGGIYNSVQSNYSAAIVAQGAQLQGGAGNAVIGTNQGSIQNNSNLSSILGGWLHTIDDAEMSAIIGGYSGRVTHDRSVVLGGMGLATDASDTVYVPSLKVKGRLFSGNTDLSYLLGSGGAGAPTYVRPGTNISTGGTASNPIINVVGSPVFTGVTASTMVAIDITTDNLTATGTVNAQDIYTDYFEANSIKPNGFNFGAIPYVNEYGFFGEHSGHLGWDPVNRTLRATYFETNDLSAATVVTLGSITAGSDLYAQGVTLVADVNATNVNASSQVSAASYISGGTSLQSVISSMIPSGLTPTYVQSGLNTQTGGTPSRPTVSVVANPTFDSVTAPFLTASIDISYQGNSLSAIFGAIGQALTTGSTFVQAGSNITTGGTATHPIVNVSSTPTFASITATDADISSATIFNHLAVGGNVAATNFLSGATNLSSVFAPISVVPTYVQAGTNTTTGGTLTRPTVSVVASPSFTNVSASTFSEAGMSLSDKYAPKSYTVSQPVATYQLQSTDNTRFLSFTGASLQYLVLPNNSTTALPIGSSYLVQQKGAGQVSFSGMAGVTITSFMSYTKTAGQGAAASIVKTATNEFALFGNLSS